MTWQIYGIPNCDQIKKTRAWCTEHDVSFDFHDIRTKGIDKTRLDHWLAKTSWELLLNKKGTTWRQMDAALKAQVVDQASARALMIKTPVIIKRPVVEIGEHVVVGYDEDVLLKLRLG